MTPLDRALTFSKSGRISDLGDACSADWTRLIRFYADAERKPGEALGRAIVRLSKSDARIISLANAANAAMDRESKLPTKERLALLKRSLAPADSSIYVENLLDRLAELGARQGESQAQSFARHLRDDEVFKAAYSAYLETPKG